MGDPWVRVDGLEDGEERGWYKGHLGSVHCVMYSPDGEIYAIGSRLRCRRSLCASDVCWTMRFIWIFGPHAPRTALCQGAPHSLLIISLSHAHPWGAPGGDYKTVVHHQSNESVGFIAEVLQALIGVVIVDKGALAAVS